MKTINDRMQDIVDVYFDGNKAAFAKKIGIAPTSITNYLGKQRASKPSADLLEKIVNSLEIDAMWLLTGKGKMNRTSIDEHPHQEATEQNIQFTDINMKKMSAKVVVEFEVTEDQFIKMGLKDNLIQVLNKNK